MKKEAGGSPLASGAGGVFRGMRSACMGFSRNPYKTHTAML